MKTKNSLISVVVALLLVGCSMHSEQSYYLTITRDDEEPTVTIRPDKTRQPDTFTPTQAITLPLITITPEVDSIVLLTSTESAFLISELLHRAQLEYKCLEIHPDLPEAGIYSGTVVITEESPHHIELLDLSTGVIQPLFKGKEQIAYVQAISPDNKWLAYLAPDPPMLIVTTFDGNPLTIELPWDNTWFGIVRWLDNSHLEIAIADEGGAKILLNPFSGEQLPLYNQFPDFAPPSLFGIDWYSAQFNHQLTRAVYPQYPEVNDNHISLWNLETQQPIANFHSAVGIAPLGSNPVWSPTGTKFVIALYRETDGGDSYAELYLISQDGEQQKITNLRAYYTESLIIREYQWSPDESKIAFWLRYSQNSQAKDQLAILDMETYQVTNYCIDDRWGTSRELVWSPNSSQIIVNAKYDEEPAVLLLDLDRQIIFRIAEEQRAVGWILSPQE